MSHPVLFVISVGGVTLGVTLLLLPWKSMGFGGSSYPSPLLMATKLIQGKETIEQKGNCRSIKGLERVIAKLPHVPEYIPIACENKGIKDDSILESKWIGLFPKHLFKENREDLVLRKEFNITTVTSAKDDGKKEGEVTYNTTFQSDRFLNQKITGSWKYGNWYIDNKIVDIVTLTDADSSENIYFVHGFYRR